MEPIIDLFDRWRVRQAGLFTFRGSQKHIGLYGKFGFQPQRLTPVLARRVANDASDGEPATFSGAAESERETMLRACRGVTDSVFQGLDVSHEIRAIDAQQLGDTVLVHDDAGLAGFAACHCGAGEAGSGTCYVKFAAVRPGRGAPERFEHLAEGFEALAAARGASRIIAGVNAAREGALGRLIDRGYATQLVGVIMQRPDEPGDCRPDAYVIDDLR
jgi:hypothetical protein